MPRAHVVSPGPHQRIVDALKPNAFCVLQDRVTAFQNKNFPGQPVEAKFKHLLQELDELSRATTDRMEWADVLLLFLGSASASKVTAVQLFQWANARNALSDTRSMYVEVRAERPNAFSALQYRCVDFHRRRFPHQNVDDLLMQLRWAAKELQADPTISARWGNVLVRYLTAAYLVGLSGLELTANAHEKMDINDRRKWGLPNEDGVVHHIEEVA